MQLRTMLAAGLVCASLSTTARADTSFAAGSIIIPTTASYQTDCGAISVYGFIYNILRANEWLQANGYGTIEVHYAVKDTKGSPNRCVPTNLLSGPTASPMWLDGCDFSVTSSNPATVPVKLIANATADNAVTDLATFNTITTADAIHASTSDPRSTYPNYASVAISAPATTTVRYGGGAFIINDQDAVTLRKLIKGSVVAQDSGGNNISFTAFTSGACTYGTTAGGNLNFHVAQVAFTAPVPKVLSAKPPRLALLATNMTNVTGTINNGILQTYLTLAGLNFAGAGGCPAGGYLRTNSPATCPSAGVGQIFDLFDVVDLNGANLAASKLGAQIAGQPAYKMFWAPHWAMKASVANATEIQVLKNIAEFGDQQFGIMAECASIATFEGYPTTPNDAVAASQFQTCTSGACGSIARGLAARSVFSHGAPSIASDSRRNCTDPNLANGSYCVYFAEPGDTFVQIGDYKYNTTLNFGTVSDFKPGAGAQYRPGVKTLISGIKTLDNTKLGSPATVRTMAGFEGEFATRHNKDNDPLKSNIIYLGFHDQTDAIAGTKVVLQTLLLLGDPPIIPTTREVTRSSPIVATIPPGGGGEVNIVQGTWEKIDPAPLSKNATNDADTPNFEFPFLIGHMRAIRAAQVSTAGTEFNALGVSAITFDAADYLPTAVAAGCGTNFTGSCRTVFTHTTAGVRPPRVFFTTGSAAVKNLVAAGLTAANQNTVVSRVLAGQPDGSGGYLSKLGGVDRSTVAVIGPSLVAGSSTRPQMVYFGATDGMLHAVCAQVAGNCDVVGRELWAFIPRTQLPRLRYNTARIDGSPRVVDLFGDFDPTDGTTSRSFKTILLLPSGSGDPGINGEQPSVTALDITDPFNPTILWEYTTPVARGITDFGTSIELTTGNVTVGASQKVVAFVHSNNGGTGLSGSVVTALDIETGLQVWQVGHEYGGLGGDPSPSPRLAASLPVPNGGIPGAALGIDLTGSGGATDVVYATLYGDVWRLDAKDGTNPYGANPLFRFTTDRKPIGASPSIFSDTPNSPTSLFVAIVSGGYFDPAAVALWSGNNHQVVAMSIKTLAANTPLSELSGGLLKFINDLPAGERGFAQPVTVGDQLFVTTDSTDVNSQAFGLTQDTGHLFAMDISNGGNFTSVVINGGAGSIASNGTTLYAASGSQIEEIGGGMTVNSAVNNATSSGSQPKATRKLWLTTL